VPIPKKLPAEESVMGTSPSVQTCGQQFGMCDPISDTVKEDVTASHHYSVISVERSYPACTQSSDWSSDDESSAGTSQLLHGTDDAVQTDACVQTNALWPSTGSKCKCCSRPPRAPLDKQRNDVLANNLPQRRLSEGLSELTGVPVVGPNIRGVREEYQLIMHLQRALFGGVYKAKGRTSRQDFAIKVLHKNELQKARETQSIEFCEVPLHEITFAKAMRGHEHVMKVEEHFEDTYCHYVVFEFCRGGDLLEALKQKPTGFHEEEAQFYMRQAVHGLAYLHGKGVAMQDVSLENMLLGVNPISGQFQVKIIDPGQAVTFFKEQNGQEIPVDFGGLVGKSFRPPELHDQKPYLATKVDSWCLGWSTFYLLTAQPLFMSADPAQKDADWQLFNKQGNYALRQKSPRTSELGINFISSLMALEPAKRLSIQEAMNNPWLTAAVPAVMAPQESATAYLADPGRPEAAFFTRDRDAAEGGA